MRSSAPRVPLTRRLLSAHPARTLAGAAGIGTALTLMLLLTGLWAGVRAQTTVFEDHTGAQLVVTSAGTDTLFAQPSLLPAATTADVAATAGVSWAVPVRTGYAILDLHGERAAIAFVGAQPNRPGAPWNVTTGRAPRGPAEVTVDATFADQHRLRLGDWLPIMGRQLRIVGITSGSAMFMTPLVWMTERQAAGLLGAPDTTGAVLVGTGDPAAVAHRLRDAGFTVRTTPQLHDAALKLATRIFGGPLRLMVAIAFAAGTLIVALVAHLLISEQRRDLGVLKAIGATGRRLAGLALAETATLTAVGAVIGLALFLAGRAALAAWRPQFPVLLTGGSVFAVTAAAALMAVLAAVLPARRVARLDAATAFRSGS